MLQVLVLAIAVPTSNVSLGDRDAKMRRLVLDYI